MSRTRTGACPKKLKKKYLVIIFELNRKYYVTYRNWCVCTIVTSGSSAVTYLSSITIFNIVPLVFQKWAKSVFEVCFAVKHL